MIKYIDCDGVILDTENHLFDRYYELKKVDNSLSKTEYLRMIDWHKWLAQAAILNDAINILKNYDPKNNKILTGVHSLPEAVEKVSYFRERDITNEIIIVPRGVSKSDMVIASGNVLVDDNMVNLSEWEEKGGIPFYYGNEETTYDKIESLDDVLNPEKLQRRLKR